jgi:predicted glycosyltransferase
MPGRQVELWHILSADRADCISGSHALVAAEICFFATSKSGLGHLRRAARIAGRLRQNGARGLHLISNAPPHGIPDAELSVFSSIHLRDRAAMACDLPIPGPKVMVLDTVTVPGIETLGAPLVLVLREAPDAELHRFRLPDARPWDLAIIANPQTHWMPSPTALNATKTRAVGWIYRPCGPRQGAVSPRPTVLVATGGGGTADTARTLYAQIDALLTRARNIAPPFDVVQAIGPRAQAFGHLAGADRIIDPGPNLNDCFRDADLVISTAGYNSVLELALTDTPALLVPIPRSIDDQAARARSWADRLGAWHDASDADQSAQWLAQQVATPQRRPPIDLGPSGEDAAARAIMALG